MGINYYSGPLTLALSPDAGEREVGLRAWPASSCLSLRMLHQVADDLADPFVIKDHGNAARPKV